MKDRLDYEKKYRRLHDAVTDALDEMKECNYGLAAALLRAARNETEAKEPPENEE